MLSIEFVTATNDFDMLERNLLASPVVYRYPLAILSNFPSVPAAYNSFNPRANWTVYVHHDVRFPDNWEDDLAAALESARSDWAILGVAGVNLTAGVRTTHGYVLDRGRPWGQPEGLPAEVDTLDEMLLIVNRKVGYQLRFDENLPFDFYGADLCCQARRNVASYLPFKSIAINAFCEHNSARPFGGRTDGFYRAEDRFRDKWKDRLPIATTCAVITAKK